MKKRLHLLFGTLLAGTFASAQIATLSNALSNSSIAVNTAQYDVSEKSMIRFNTDATTPLQREQMNQQRLAELNASNPNYAYDRNAYEVAVQQYIHDHPNTQNTTQSVITLPVVVHVVYNSAAQNIPTNQVLSQIQVLNEDFGRTNTDQNTHWSQAVNTTIQFCLAQQDPNGNATTGIDRVSTTVTSFSTNDNVKHAATGGANAWDPTRYLNIWVCNLGSGLLGYGEFPTATVSQTMGVVILYSAFGSNYTSYGTFATVASPYDRGRTTTHEFSHCFNLYHIWGDDAGACSGSDLCADTPNQADATTTCYTFPHTDACTTTNPGIMFENYMDYSYDNCLNLFTNDQKTRMLAVLNTSPYNALQTSTGCQSPATSPPTALFAATSTSVCPGTPITFTDMSTSNTTSWSWTFPSGTPASSTAQNPGAVTWNTAGTYTVTLVASNVNGSSTYTMAITVLGVVSPPLVEGFEAATFPPSGWTNYDAGANGMVWSRYAAGHNSSYSALFDNYNNNVGGTRDELRTPKIDFSTASTVTMTFDVAYRRYNTSTANYDSLEVAVSTNCGATWTSVYLKGGTTLQTVTTTSTAAFVPTNAQWRTETVNLNTYAGQGGVMICFRNRGHYGQGIYVDNVNITTTTSALPSATFTASATTVCAGTAVSFTDNSTNSPTSWTWTFPSGTPASATTQNVASVVWNTAGTYTVTHTATNGSGTGTTTQVITVNALPTVTTTTTGGTICSGSSTTITAAGASTYAWMPGSLTGTTVTVSPTTTTTYTVTGTNANGCTNTATRTITVNPSPTVTTTTTNATICSGNSTSMTASGASTYTWMPGSLTGATVTVSPTTTTTYTVTGTSANGCTSTATRTITVNPTPTVTTTATSTTICSGSSTTITASGATTYAWMPGSLTGTSVTVSPTTTTTYTVTGTSTGCSGTATRVITVNPSPTVTTTTSGGTICSGNSTTMTASGASTYSWMPGSLTGTTVTVSPTTTTTYTVTGTSANGCTNTATRTITVNPSPTVTISASSTSICTGNSVTLTGSGGSTYAWMPGSLTGSSVTVTPGSTTTYTLTGTAANGCTNSTTQTITVGAQPTVTASSSGAICNGGSATLTGSGATTYTWMPGSLSGTSVTVSPTTTTTYTVTGTVSAGCSNTATVAVTVNPTPTVTASASNTSICAGSSTTLTASGATSYTWNPGSLTGSSVSVSPASTTTYTVTGTNASGCTNTAVTTITVNAIPVVSASASSSAVCAGSSVTLTGSGASTYTWMPGSLSGASVTSTPASATTYTVTGTDANGCTNTSTVNVAVNALPTVAASASNSTVCAGSTVTLTGSGASTYTWMPGSLSGASVTDTPAAATTYTVTGTDANGCSNTSTVNVAVNALPVISATASSNNVCEGSTVTLDATGASTYNWQPINQAGATVSDIPASTTTYTVTGVDANGCSNSSLVTVTVNPAPAVTATASSTAICTGSQVTLDATGASTYDWQPINQTGSTVVDAPASTTTYTLTGTDANGCTNTSTVLVTVNANPAVTATGDVSVCEGSSATLTAAGASTYSWQPNGQTTGTITENPATTTTYTVTGTDANGCTGSATWTVTVNPLPSTPSIIVNGATLTSSVSGASYQWYLNGNPIAGATSQSYTATQTGDYTVVVTDANGCSSSPSGAVTDPTGIAVNSNVQQIAAYPNPNNGHFQLNFSVNKADNFVLEIHDVLGQVVYTETLSNFSGNYSREIDLGAFARGVYTVRLKGTSGESVVRVVTY